ncbi:MAG: ISNCY family transposase [Bacteroidota bacterium]
MRTVHEPQMSFGEIDISNIKLNPKCRDDIPAILSGLQFIYVTPELHDSVFNILKTVIPKRINEDSSTEEVSSTLGRPGMAQWKILVFGVLRLGLNTDYDRIHDLANNHSTIRQMLGHSDWDDTHEYSLQTIKDNLKLFTPEVLDQINQEVIKAGHSLVKKKQKDGLTVKNKDLTCQDKPPVAEKLRGRCDSFVLETNVHFPTDISLLFDAVRKSTIASAQLAELYELAGWRQFQNNIKKFKKQYRKIQILKHSTSKDETKKIQRDELIKAEYRVYIEMAEERFNCSKQAIDELKAKGCADYELITLEQYQEYSELLRKQVYRRVINEEVIPHSEKIFSIFQPHTEWISKGKAGVPVELGLRICIMEDQHQFILHSKVMEKITDDKIAIEMVTETQKRFPNLACVSFDKGYHSKNNQKELKEHLEQVILPKKGRLSEADKLREGSDEFKSLRNKHSGVESAINGLEHGGLDVCPDHGLHGFKRYVSLAVLSRNIKRLGAIIRQKEKDKEERKRGSYKKRA